MVKLLVALIRIYQWTLSPDHGPLRRFHPYGYCKYYPSCSMYAAEALKSHGVMLGIFLAAKRVIRCNPWSQGGLDPVPKKK